MDKKRALICSVTLYTVGTLTLAVYLVGAVILKAIPAKFNTFLPILFVMFYLGGVTMTFVYLRLRKLEKTATSRRVYAKPDFDDDEFKKWLVNFEPFVKIAKKLNVSNNTTFSKFGGMPNVPKNFVWPTSSRYPSYEQTPLPFLLELDFAEINGDGALADFPQNGLMYVFVDEDDVNDPDFKDGEEPYAEGRTFKILYFDDAEDLTPAQKPTALAKIYKEFYVAPETVKTYPNTEDCQEAFDIYCNRPVGGMDDAYDVLQGENMDSTLIGGWASYIQGQEILTDDKHNEWILLMQIPSYFDVSWENCITWGDAGVIYMFIRKTDLTARNFNNVKFDMQCT